MAEVVHSACDMIFGMTPEVRHGEYVFVTVKDPLQITTLAPDTFATFNEAERVSMLLPIELAVKSNLCTDQSMSCITLNVYSSLEGVG